MIDLTDHTCVMVCEPDLLDSCVCSCGWRSLTYYDGVEFAYAAYSKHLADVQNQEVARKDERLPGP